MDTIQEQSVTNKLILQNQKDLTLVLVELMAYLEEHGRLVRDAINELDARDNTIGAKKGRKR